MYRKLRALMPLVLLVGLALASVSDAALVGWWKFDDGSGEVAKDSSGKGYHGTITNPLWVAGHYGGALNFEGTSYVDVPPESWSTIERQATVSFWAYGNPDLQPQANFIFGAFSDPANNEARRMSAHVPWSDGTIYFDTGGPSYNRINKAGSATDYEGTWTFWTFLKNADTGDQQVYINGELWHSGTGMTNTMEGVTKFTIGTKPSLAEGWYQGMIDDFRLYDHALTLEEIQLAMTGRGPGLELASDPVPENEATDIPRDVVLSWGAGEYAATHDVYFGASFDDVNAASRSNPMGLLASQAQAATSYDPPGRLDFGTTYYWRVDEVNAAPDNTIFKGEVWSFTTEPFAYPIANVVATSNGTSDATAGPQNTVNGSGLDAADQHSTVSSDMWLATPGTDPLWIQFEFDRVYKLHEMLVWNSNSQFELILGFGIKGVTVDYSENGTDWTALGDFEFARATAKPTYTANTTVDLGGIPARFVRLNVNGGWGTMGQYGLSEVRFLYVPAQAREPQPADGATDVEVGTALAWRSGREAVSHQVYLGTDADALTLAGTVDVATFAPALEFGSTYYWQVDEVNEADAVTTWAGDLWSFSTQEYALIDGFETYNDDVDAKTTIFDTWLDGWVNETGSTVGYLNAPFAEKTIIRTGTQSMPLAYDNSVSPFYSEAWREFETAQDWSGNGADTLVLYVRGNAPGFVEAADGAIIMNGIGTDIWNNGDQFRYAYKSLSGNGSITVRVDSIALSNEWAKAGVMIRETLEAGSKHAFVALTPTPSHGLSFQRRPTADAASANTDVADIALPHWVKLTRTGNVFAAQQSEDGETWTDIVVSPALDIAMAANVYIGLAVCSHDTAIVTGAEFSNVSTTGNVTGAWQTAEIGIAQPAGNSSESMYVTIEDSAGKSATVVNADAAITVRPSWQEWAIPFSDLAGVNLSRVTKMVVGVGSKASPKAGGAGTVYVDDIGFGSPIAP
ncbi:MAG TPA: discoidin domain-containing protein [Sedimentisphaerales bacterium]|nr:discoidin domain-containing protein [Sedimentisphaerales bacterium]